MLWPLKPLSATPQDLNRTWRARAYAACSPKTNPQTRKPANRITVEFVVLSMNKELGISPDTRFCCLLFH
jgi:hypothetical protein